MKKLISITVALPLLISALAPCAFAETDMEKTVADVKARAGISNEYTDFSSDYYEDGGLTTYDFNWSDDEGNFASVTYNSDDVITSYYIYDGSRDEINSGSIPKISLDEAKSAAQNFIDKLNPDSKDEFVISLNGSLSTVLNGNYTFKLERYKNGAKVFNNSGTVRVNRDNAKIESMYISYTHIDSFADISDRISADEAKAAFKEKLGLELVYESYTDNGNLVMFPAYIEKENNQYINAATGEIYEPETLTYRNFSSASVSEDTAGDSGGGIYLTEVETNELDKIAGLISKTDMESNIRANTALSVPDDMPMQSISLSRSYYDDTQYTYVMFFTDYKSSVSVSADAKTGEILSYYLYEDSDYEENLGEEKTQAAADKVWNALAGSKKSEFIFSEVEDGTAVYQRYVNGIKVRRDTARIGFDGGGKLISYSVSYSANVDFPSVDNAISAEEEADKMFDEVSYDLTYYPNESLSAEAVYKLSESVKINPFTGNIVNYRNEETDDTKYEYNDIDGHYAKTQIEALAYYGIGLDGDKFLPNEKITQRDFLYMVMSAVNPYSDYDDDDELYNSAIRSSYLSETDRDDNAQVTRENAAKLIIRVMGAESFALYDEIYVTPFSDVTENKGYIAILSAMKIINGDGSGKFNPYSSLTRADAACIIYNYLNR